MVQEYLTEKNVCKINCMFTWPIIIEGGDDEVLTSDDNFQSLVSFSSAVLSNKAVFSTVLS